MKIITCVNIKTMIFHITNYFTMFTFVNLCFFVNVDEEHDPEHVIINRFEEI